MARPQIYINVSQTIAVGTLAVGILSYILDKDFRHDLNDLVLSMRMGYR